MKTANTQIFANVLPCRAERVISYETITIFDQSLFISETIQDMAIVTLEDDTTLGTELYILTSLLVK